MHSALKSLAPLLSITFLVIASKQDGYAQNPDLNIQAIKEEVIAINQYTSYDTVTLNNEEFLEEMSDGGGQLRGYFKEDTLVKILERIGLSYCIRENTYFFRKGELIYVAQEENAFTYVDSIGSFDYSSYDLIFQGKYYFDSGKAAKSELTGKKRIDDQMDSQAKAKLLMNTAERNRNLLLETYTKRDK